MKKILVCAFFAALISVAAYADIPAKGKYLVEIIGTSTTLILEINNTEWSFSSEDDLDAEVTTVKIDKKNKRVYIPMFEELAEYFVYKETKEYTDLYFGEKYNLDIADIMIDSMGEMNGVNSVTDDFVSYIVEKVIKIFQEVPIIRLRKM
ncbi:MAG: hypothetical protein Ta2B_19020 [Termitinemataceae bacterium]|nr:MAG: hypothetical protein Ta2B_19020 [Termitinemataceae bacterium]